MCKIPFYKRHIGLQEQDIEYMLNYLGFNSLDQFSDNALPDSIKSLEPLDLPTALSEDEALELIDEIIAKNTLKKSFIGQGYHGSFTPPVIQRNLFENPAWYTSYTPYQAEISQGLLELLFHFQTLVAELTGLPIANASLLDEATAIAEAMALAVRYFKGKRTNIAIGGILHPQNKAVLLTRAKHKNYNIVEYARQTDLAALIVPLMDSYGAIWNYSSIIEETKKTGALIIFVADPLALTIAKNVAKQGADIAVGSMQRFGIAMGFGGPSAAYMAVQEKLTRLMPGRIIGLSKDTQNNPAYRLALQTREQHIRRDKANSNICTSQALLANMSAAYAIWHGPQGLQNIALSVHHMACRFAAACKKAGLSLYSDKFFDCVTINIKGKAEYVKTKAYDSGILLRIIDENMISVNFDETSSEEDYKKLLAIFALNDSEQITEVKNQRDTEFLSQPIFNSINSETDMMRFLRALSDKDLALDRAMIPLGSCTMKMNAAAELMPLSNPKWSNIHPLATKDAEGYFELMEDLEELLCAITGLVKISFQPNSGAQGEFAGLLVIKEYLRSKKVSHRNICLIPASAHGTNPASAQMAGFEIVVVECAENGDIDIEDLKLKLQQYSENLAVLMVTYPSTHGVYEENIRDICDLVHGCGGQIYLDGANLNALIGLSKISDIGIDVCHMNLHKTFAIPHGGGGPGCGPIAVAEHLVKFLPSIELKDFMVSSAPYGSASLLVISWMYIRMMGAVGLKKASQCAILSANYVAKRLEEGNYKILYKGKNNFVAHEVIIDTRLLKEKFNITGEDVAKRLIDYGFHAPTMSFPVPGTLMIEPTESESKIELDRFCDAMISIYKEAENINNDIWLKDDNPLINAPHTAQEALLSEWKHCYSREIALYPSLYTKKFKYFPPVARIDNVTGDRNLVCGCVPINAYKKEV